MKTLLMLGVLGQEQEIALEKELPSFGEAFIAEKQISLEELLGVQVQRKKQRDLLFGVKEYEYILLKKEDYALFLFGRTTNIFPYNSFEQYPVLGIAFKVEF